MVLSQGCANPTGTFNQEQQRLHVPTAAGGGWTRRQPLCLQGSPCERRTPCQEADLEGFWDLWLRDPETLKDPNQAPGAWAR